MLLWSNQTLESCFSPTWNTRHNSRKIISLTISSFIKHRKPSPCLHKGANRLFTYLITEFTLQHNVAVQVFIDTMVMFCEHQIPRTIVWLYKYRLFAPVAPEAWTFKFSNSPFQSVTNCIPSSCLVHIGNPIHCWHRVVEEMLGKYVPYGCTYMYIVYMLH